MDRETLERANAIVKEKDYLKKVVVKINTASQILITTDNNGSYRSADWSITKKTAPDLIELMVDHLETKITELKTEFEKL